MINLIPNEQKKKKVNDFYFRLVVVFLFVLGFSVLIACVIFLPSYFLSSVKKNFADNQLMVQKKEPIPGEDQAILAEVADLDAKLILIENTQKKKYDVSTKIINEILSKKMSDIKINQISYENHPASGKSVRIYGTAGSRERLLLFRRTLEDNPEFKTVDLPISNFVKGSNISFFLSLIPL